MTHSPFYITCISKPFCSISSLSVFGAVPRKFINLLLFLWMSWTSINPPLQKGNEQKMNLWSDASVYILQQAYQQ